jgi:hypothetical protein
MTRYQKTIQKKYQERLKKIGRSGLGATLIDVESGRWPVYALLRHSRCRLIRQVTRTRREKVTNEMHVGMR